MTPEKHTHTHIHTHTHTHTHTHQTEALQGILNSYGESCC